MRKGSVTFIIFLFLGISSGFAQGEIADEAKVFFRNERTFAGTLYSNGWGLDYSKTRRRDAFSSYSYGFGFSSVNHPKEYKSQSPYTAGWGRSYVFGKLNEVATLKAGVGFQKEWFSKFDKGGIAIRYFYSGGLSLALMKPIYYLKIVRIDYETGQIIYDPALFDPDYMQSIYDIFDRESFFVGIDETKLNPGLFIRGGLSFEYSANERSVNALEGGLQLEGFLKEIPLMAGNDHKRLLLSLFVTYRFGKIIDQR
jgi:hypothetical protein